MMFRHVCWMIGALAFIAGACSSDNGRPAGSSTGGTSNDSGSTTGGSSSDHLCVDALCNVSEGSAPPGCGDGILTEDEVCDDGNGEDGDGCSGNCLSVERGWSCPTPGEPCIRIAICGDGVVSFPEQCDDGNVEDRDGCSSRCKLEPGHKCDGEPSSCSRTVCGDGVVEGAEACDDGNLAPFDGCSPTCQWEPDCPSTGACEQRCGDGLLMHPEQCDDGNLIDGDGCSSECTVEQGYECNPLTSLGDTMRVPIIYRDLRRKNSHDDASGHPDFFTGGDACGGWENAQPGIVEDTLDADRKPAYTGLPCHIESEASFATWFRDTNHSKTFPEFLELNHDGNKYVFDAPRFFPLDGRGWVTEEPPETEATHIANDTHTDGGIYGDGLPHNFIFTSEVRYWFEYDPSVNAEFFFRGDDDVWVFVGGKLVVDLGGTHAPLTGSFTLDAATGTELGLEASRVYEIAVFHAERNPVISSYRLELTGFNPAPSDCVALCGDGIIGLGEECDDGVENNTGGYGRCGPDCKLSQYCGDGIVQEGEHCDDGSLNGQPGHCPSGCRRIVVR